MILKLYKLKIRFKRPILLLTFLTVATYAHAQAGGELSNALLIGLFSIALLILLAVVTLVGDTFLRIESREIGADETKANYSVFPKLSEIFGAKRPTHLDGANVIDLKRGHDILLQGEAEKVIDTNVQPKTYAIRPQDFVGMSPIPKVLVEKGDEVKAGDILFFDKKRPNVKYASPVSGEVIDVTRGEKRAIDKVIILADKEQKYRDFNKPVLGDLDRENLVAFLLEIGAWSFIRQRPFDLVANPEDMPKAIFVSTFDSAPLAPDLNFALKGREYAFQTGLDVLNRLTEGKVHLGLNGKSATAPSSVFTAAQGVEKHWFNGPHPAGNVGVQIHHIDPINKGDVVWYMNPQDVASLGAIFTEGIFKPERLIAVTGAELKRPRYFRAPIGASVEEMLADNIKPDNKVRVVAGDVLTGTQIDDKGYLGFFDDQVTVLFENDNYTMFGWLSPFAMNPSVSKTFPGAAFKDYKYRAETNTHGEHRALVVTGQYESVLPMDVYPQHLVKAILTNDFERMEGLGIYELSPEDVALCEFACTSKTDVQAILREGLEMVREQS